MARKKLPEEKGEVTQINLASCNSSDGALNFLTGICFPCFRLDSLSQSFWILCIEDCLTFLQ